ncbi:hypothetical protein B0H16DRAFT_1592604 [Mycena metata]|uniref:Uncharacterized protein n=1 Tax=Mycena metata TaxID=1033252 RepID=A0AAD7HS41_9AGAR|nr:hypothetical protein B0H16DRAFT_1592604 [Mycena metata]
MGKHESTRPGRTSNQTSFFANSKDFIITGGEFTNVSGDIQLRPSNIITKDVVIAALPHHSIRVIPLIRVIPHADIELGREIPEESSRHPHSSRRVYSAIIHKSQPVVVVRYEGGDSAEKEWRLNIAQSSSRESFSALVPSHPYMFGVSSGVQMYTVIYTQTAHPSKLGQVNLALKLDHNQYVAVSLPMEYCRTWQAFCYCLIGVDIKRLAYLKDSQFVVRLEDDGNRLLFGEQWEEWILSGGYHAQTHVVLCVIRGDSCCEQQTDDGNGFCQNCGVQFIEDIPATSVVTEPVQNSIQVSTTPVISREAEEIMLNESVPFMPIPLQVDSNPSATSFFKLSAQNSVVRRRRLPTPLPSEEPINHVSPTPEGHTYPPNQQSQQISYLSGASAWVANLGQTTLHHFGVVYIFLINPPWIRDTENIWDRERLGARLDALKSWVWSANAAISATAAALLALSGVPAYPLSQSFLILSGIFSFFGFVYASFLAFHIGEHEEQFTNYLCNIQPRHTFWSPSIMLSLPLTWMSWSLFSFLCFLAAVGLEVIVPKVGTTVSLSAIQLVGFTVPTLWSLVYVVMVHIEIRRCLGAGHTV